MSAFVHWFLRIIGVDDTTGPWYAFWSGFAGDIPLFGVFVVLYRKHNCHQSGCWRVQMRVHTDGRSYCRKHHPEEP